MKPINELCTTVSVPEGEQGIFKIKKFTVSDDEASTFNLGQLLSRQGGRGIKPGTYTKLVGNGRGTIMSDTPAERRDHFDPIYEAHGKCLINGFGIGMVLQAFLRKDEVEHVTVIELEQDIIDLVAPHYFKMFGEKRLSIICADAYTYTPPKGERYQCVWHDIWNEICEDNWKLYSKLHRKYGRKTDWQGSWARNQVKYLVDQEKRGELYT